MDRALAIPSSGNSWDKGGVVLNLGALFVNKTVPGSPSGDGSQHADSNTAIESFWGCIFVEISVLLWSIGVPGGPRSVTGGSQGRARGPRGVPRGTRGVPRGSLASLGAPGTSRA